MIVAGLRYPATVLKTVHSSDRSGYACLKVQVAIADPEGGDEVSLWGTIYTSPKAIGMARKQLQALGFDCDTQDFDKIGQPGGIDLAGRAVNEGIETEEYNGNLKVKNFGQIGVSKKSLQAATSALRAAKKSNKPDDPGVDGFDRQIAEDEAAARGLDANPEPGSAIGKEPTDDQIPF